jgi:hypothetical protein
MPTLADIWKLFGKCPEYEATPLPKAKPEKGKNEPKEKPKEKN